MTRKVGRPRIKKDAIVASKIMVGFTKKQKAQLTKVCKSQNYDSLSQTVRLLVQEALDGYR